VADAERPAAEEALKKSKGGTVAKVLTTVFATIVAPILVAVGIRLTARWTDPPSPTTEAQLPATTEALAPNGALTLVTPDLKNHFYTYAWDDAVRQEVPRDTIDPALFRYDQRPARIVVPGDERWALLTSSRSFEDYSLQLWFRWGTRQWGPAEGRPRRAAVLLHVTGPDGGWKGMWPQCVTIHLGEGDTGTIRLAGVPKSISCRAAAKEAPDRLRRFVIGPDGKEVPQVLGVPPAWQGIIQRLGFPEDIVRDSEGYLVGVKPGWRPSGDPTWAPPYKENQWNRVVISCHNDTVTVTVNGKLVNEITGLNVTKGRLAIASQGSELEIVRCDITSRQSERHLDRPPETSRERHP
jgi:hypothetical protein